MGRVASQSRKQIGMKISGSAHSKIEPFDGLTGDEAVRDVFATDDTDQAKALLSQILYALNEKEVRDDQNQDMRNLAITLIHEAAPRDAFERMLVVQMVTTHIATMRAGKWLANSDMIPQTQAISTAYNKLARTFTTQMEAIRKHRNGGKQTVTVQHVNIEDGGQAIVGNVGGGKP